MLEKETFREYDIRGIYNVTLNDETGYLVGKSYGSKALEMGAKEVIVGYDNRLSSPSIHKKMIQGLLETGINIIDLGLVTTPMLYFARKHLNNPFGIMITASHNPKEYNGFKFSFTSIGNAYGKDIEGYNYNMANLLSDVAKTGIKRIKFVTSHPWDFTDDMISVIRDNENVLPYVHLPVQSGSNKILKLMGRKYTRESYLELVHKLRENIPNLCLTTDIIVGFPNETDEDFNDTLSIVNECKYDQAYTFIYSKRVGTPAAAMEDSIPILKKEERLQVLNELINKYSLESNKKLLNKVVDVLIDCKSEKEGMLSGYTSNNKLVNVCAPISYIGKIAKVKITECKTWSLDGVLDE